MKTFLLFLLLVVGFVSYHSFFLKPDPNTIHDQGICEADGYTWWNVDGGVAVYTCHYDSYKGVSINANIQDPQNETFHMKAGQTFKADGGTYRCYDDTTCIKI